MNRDLDRLREIIRELTRQADLAKSESWTAAETAREYLNVYQFDEQLHTIAAEINKLKARMSYVDIPAAFEREGLTTFTLAEGYRITLSSYVSASCRDMAAGIEWMKATGHGALVKETINAQTLGAFARAEMEEGRELPDALFNVSAGQRTSVTQVRDR